MLAPGLVRCSAFARAAYDAGLRVLRPRRRFGDDEAIELNPYTAQILRAGPNDTPR